MAAIFAAREGANTTIFESNPMPGRKLLLTGGGRCNLTHEGTVEEFIAAYKQYGRFLRHSLWEFSPAMLREYFSQSWLSTKVDPRGCVFPVTDRAGDVKRILVDNARRAGVRFVVSAPVEVIEYHGTGFVVKGGGESVKTASVIIATGGKSYSNTGSTGDGYEFARGFGHTITPPKAALTGLVTAGSWEGELSGVSIPEAKVRAKLQDRTVESFGPIVFTQRGVSGPAILDISREITDYLTNMREPVQLYLDLLVTHSVDELTRLIDQRCEQSPKKELAGILTGLLPRAVALNICAQLSENIIKAGNLSRKDRLRLVKLIKYLPVTVTATGSLEEAIVTRGGVSTDQIDSRSMQSKLCRGLFFAGEVIDVDGPCGGYNLQICWSTGAAAGKSAARLVIGTREIKEIKGTSKEGAYKIRRPEQKG